MRRRDAGRGVRAVGHRKVELGLGPTREEQQRDQAKGCDASHGGLLGAARGGSRGASALEAAGDPLAPQPLRAGPPLVGDDCPPAPGPEQSGP